MEEILMPECWARSPGAALLVPCPAKARSTRPRPWLMASPRSPREPAPSAAAPCEPTRTPDSSAPKLAHHASSCRRPACSSAPSEELREGAGGADGRMSSDGRQRRRGRGDTSYHAGECRYAADHTETSRQRQQPFMTSTIVHCAADARPAIEHTCCLSICRSTVT